MHNPPRVRPLSGGGAAALPTTHTTAITAARATATVAATVAVTVVSLAEISHFTLPITISIDSVILTAV